MRNEIIIYTTQYCPYCHSAIRFLKSKNVSFKEIDVSDDDAMRQKLVEMSGGKETVPQIFVNEKPIGGYIELVEYYDSGQTL